MVPMLFHSTGQRKRGAKGQQVSVRESPRLMVVMHNNPAMLEAEQGVRSNTELRNCSSIEMKYKNISSAFTVIHALS